MKKTLQGIVVSIKTKETPVVEITRTLAHPLYKKLLKRSKKYKVAAGEFSLHVGDEVSIVPTRPISKTKYFKIHSVVKKIQED